MFEGRQDKTNSISAKGRTRKATIGIRSSSTVYILYTVHKQNHERVKCFNKGNLSWLKLFNLHHNI